LKLSKPRLGDAGQRAILEFVGGSAAAAAQSPRLETARR
jgi:hypothetical protein